MDDVEKIKRENRRLDILYSEFMDIIRKEAPPKVAAAISEMSRASALDLYNAIRGIRG